MLRVPTWAVVLVGLLFNILAALIAHFMIEAKSNHLANLSMQAAGHHKEMELLWAQIEGIERKRETLYLLMNSGQINHQVIAQYSALLQSHLQQPIILNDVQQLGEIDSLINAYQQQIREKIDDKFFLNLALQELEMQLQKSISTLRNWSIFLQMIGLSLILARDLNR